jgi:ribonucleoside-diphosphate reductase alpha chain
MLPFTSSEAQDLNVSIFRTIQIHALRASRMLAKLLGEPEWCKGTGMRNTHVMAQAPTKSTSLLMGGLSEGIAPYLGMVFEANSAGGSVSRIPKYFLKFLKEKGHYAEGTLASITSNLGSVQHLTWMTEKEKLVFRNAFEINQMELLDMASARQPYIDQAQSINLFIPLINTDNRGEVEKLFSSLMTRAISDENILSLYYTQSRNGAIINNECLPCSA